MRCLSLIGLLCQLMLKKQKEDESYYIPLARPLAQELGARITVQQNGDRVAALWEVIYDGISFSLHEPESVYMLLSGIRLGMKGN